MSASRGAFLGILAVGSALLLFLPGCRLKRLLYVGGHRRQPSPCSRRQLLGIDA